MAVRPLRPATDRRLGELLPHQPANRPRAHPQAPASCEARFALVVPPTRTHAGLSAISRRYPSLGGQVTHVLLTRPPLPLSPKQDRAFDLHVLGTPPAFILSQDQTRHPFVRSICCPLPLMAPGDARFVRAVFKSRSRPSALYIVLGCSQIHSGLCAHVGAHKPQLNDRNCCGRLRVAPSCCSAFHSSVVKVQPEASFAHFFAAF